MRVGGVLVHLLRLHGQRHARRQRVAEGLGFGGVARARPKVVVAAHGHARGDAGALVRRLVQERYLAPLTLPASMIIGLYISDERQRCVCVEKWFWVRQSLIPSNLR